jgi:hypothetical protein
VTGKRTIRMMTGVAIILFQPAMLSAQTMRVPGTSVALAPPPGFILSVRFPGFEHEELQASIMVTEIAGPFDELTRGMTPPGLASRGMTLISSATPQVPGKHALLLHVAQSSGGTAYLKWMLVFGDSNASAMIVATFPKSAEAALSETMKGAVLSAVPTATAPVDHFEGLSFRVSPTPVFKIAGRMSNMLLLNEAGTMAPQEPNAAIFVVGNSLGPVPGNDLRAFAEARARQTRQLKSLQILRQGPITIDAIAGHELVAQGTDVATGIMVTLYQVLLPDGGGYVLMQGMVASGRAAELLPEFRRVSETFRRLPPR